MPGRVTVRTTDGREFTDGGALSEGQSSEPDGRRRVRGKFMNMAERVLGDEQSDELYQRAREVAQ